MTMSEPTTSRTGERHPQAPARALRPGSPSRRPRILLPPVRPRTRHNERWLGPRRRARSRCHDRRPHRPPADPAQLSARDDQCVAVGTSLSQQGAGLRPLIGDGCAFGIVLVVRGDQLGTLNDGGDDGLERCNLTGCPLLLGLDDRQEALDVACVHPDELASPPVHRNRRNSDAAGRGWRQSAGPAPRAPKRREREAGTGRCLGSSESEL